MQATVSSKLDGKYSEGVKTMVQSTMKKYLGTPVEALSHQDILVLSKALNLLPVSASEVVRFLDAQTIPTCGCGVRDAMRQFAFPMSLEQVDEWRAKLAKCYHTAHTMEQVVQTKAFGVAISYVQSTGSTQNFYHPILPYTIRQYFGADGLCHPFAGVWMDKLAKYQNEACRNNAWGKMGEVPYMDLPVLAVLPMCTSTSAPERATIPLFHTRFLLDEYWHACASALWRKQNHHQEVRRKQFKSEQQPFFDELYGILNDNLVREIMHSFILLYGADPKDGQPQWPLMSPWFRTWPMMERFMGIHWKGLYMEAHSWKVAVLILLIMDIVATSSSASNRPLQEAVESLHVQHAKDKKRTSESEKGLLEINPEEIALLLNLVDVLYYTLLNVQFRIDLPENYEEMVEALRNRRTKRGANLINWEKPTSFDWSNAMEDLCRGEQLFSFLQTSVVAHADIYSNADKVDVAVGLLCGMGGSNSLNMLASILRIDEPNDETLQECINVINPETRALRVVDTALLATPSEALDDRLRIPLLSLAPLVTQKSLTSWMVTYVGLDANEAVRQVNELRDSIFESMNLVCGFFVLIHSDMSCQLEFQNVTEAEIDGVLHQYPKSMGSWKQEGALQIHGTLHFLSLRDDDNDVLNFVWLIGRLHVSEDDKDAQKVVWKGERVTHQLAWRHCRDDNSVEDRRDFDAKQPPRRASNEREEEERIIDFAEELQHLSNTLDRDTTERITFWRKGSLTSGFPVFDFVEDLLKSYVGSAKVDAK